LLDASFTGRATSALGSPDSKPARWETSFGQVSWSGRVTALFPGRANDLEYVPFAVTKIGHADDRLSSITASISTAANGDAQTAGGADLPGCRASWFTVSVRTPDRPLPADVGPADSYTGVIVVAMQDSGIDQDACENESAAIAIAAT
jgi:hypothetical protein